VVKQPQGLEGPTHITLVTDNANHLVLHWGVSRAGEALISACFAIVAIIVRLDRVLSHRQPPGAALGGQQGR
jgi:hypothetical protein